MPELPDVEALRAMFEKHALARTIEEVVVREAKALQDATVGIPRHVEYPRKNFRKRP